MVEDVDEEQPKILSMVFGDFSLPFLLDAERLLVVCRDRQTCAR